LKMRGRKAICNEEREEKDLDQRNVVMLSRM
jgi:hypothetical protein